MLAKVYVVVMDRFARCERYRMDVVRRVRVRVRGKSKELARTTYQSSRRDVKLTSECRLFRNSGTKKEHTHIHTTLNMLQTGTAAHVRHTHFLSLRTARQKKGNSEKWRPEGWHLRVNQPQLVENLYTGAALGEFSRFQLSLQLQDSKVRETGVFAFSSDASPLWAVKSFFSVMSFFLLFMWRSAPQLLRPALGVTTQ